MTAAVPDPDPGFRDQLADVLAHHAFSHVNADGWTVCLCGHVAEGDDDDGSHARHQADVIAAEVGARVQAAANQRAAEEMEAAAAAINEQRWSHRNGLGSAREAEQLVRARAAALASPAPAPRAEEWQ